MDKSRKERITDALACIRSKLEKGVKAETERDELSARLTALAKSLGVDADGLTDKIDALTKKAADMDGVAKLVSSISTTAYKLLPSGIRALLDKYRT